MTILPWDDPRIESQLRPDLSFVQPMIDLETEGGQYFMKNTVAFGLTLGQEEDTAGTIETVVEDLTTHATRRTLHFGEAMVVIGEGAQRRADQGVASPHLWEGVLFYLTAMAQEQPQLLLAHERTLPASRLRRRASGCAPRARVAAGHPPCDCAGRASRS